jgi:hypothetical protein
MRAIAVVIVALSEALLGATAQAQTARVNVIDAGTSTPIPGVIVSLVGADGRRSHAALTNAEGNAVLRADAAGSYSVRAERVGFEPGVSASVALGGPEPVVRIALAPRRVRLSAVAVKGKRQCGNDVAHAVNTLTLWDEVRKALTATVLAQGERLPALPVLTYARLVDRRLRVESESTHTRTSTSGSAFRTAAPDELARTGYVREVGGMVFDFYGPDAALLLSDPFVRDHCFSVVQGRRQDSTMVGLAFEPVGGRKVPDIAGVLWLDRDSAELRHIDYRYTNLPYEILADRSEGHIEFARLPNGRWIVARWQIRTPRLAAIPDQQVGSVSVARRYEVIGYKEQGGIVDVVGVARGASAAPQPPTGIASVGGVANDTLLGAPPSVTALRRRCDGAVPSPRGGSDGGVLLTGVIRQPLGGAPAAGGRALIWWDTFRVSRTGSAVLVRHYADTVDVQADGSGAFSVCGVPHETEVVMRAIPNGPIVRRTFPRDTRLAEIDLTSGVSSGRAISIRGTIASAATGRALAGAEVTIPELSRTTRTGADGAFVLPGLPSGRYEVHARSVGFTPAVRAVATDQGDVSQVSFALSPVVTELSGVDIEARRGPPNNQSDFERRRASGVGGTFVTRRMLDARASSKLSDVLRTHATGIRFPSRGMGGHAAASTRSDGSVDARRPRDCYMQIILDGVRVFGPSQLSPITPPPDVDRYSSESLESVEVYAGPAETPPEFAGADATCGTIVLTSRRP